MTETTTTTPTVSAAMGNGDRVDVPTRWHGRALCVHAPVAHVRDGKRTRGVWAITGHVHGLSAGVYRGKLADAVRLARVWDDAFADALPTWRTTAPNLSKWPHAQEWGRQLRGETAPVGPAGTGETVRTRPRVAAADGDGAEQLPVTPTITPAGSGRVRYAATLNNGKPRLRHPETGAALRMHGDVVAFKGADPFVPVFRLWWHGVWVDVPTIAECMEWAADGIAETPAGDRVETDAPDSWLSLLGVV
jgi:hypothetical protein